MIRKQMNGLGRKITQAFHNWSNPPPDEIILLNMILRALHGASSPHTIAEMHESLRRTGVNIEAPAVERVFNMNYGFVYTHDGDEVHPSTRRYGIGPAGRIYVAHIIGAA